MPADPDFVVEKWSVYSGEFFYGYHKIIIVYEYGDDIRYFIVTSQIEKAEKRSLYDPASLVKIDPLEWDKLTCPSCIECSRRNLQEIPKDKLKRFHDARFAKYKGKLPDIVRKKIIDAINASVTYSESEKQKLTKE